MQLDFLDLPHHAKPIDDCLSNLHAVARSPVDQHLVRKGIQGHADQFGEAIFVGLTLGTTKQRAQAPVLFFQCFQPLQGALLAQQTLRQQSVFRAQGASRLELSVQVTQGADRPGDSVVDRFGRIGCHTAHARDVVAAVVHGHKDNR